MATHIVDYSLHRIDVRLRMPFRYGIATMTDGPVLFLRLETEIEGRRQIGVASDLLPPKWFTKVPAKPIEDEIAEMLRVIGHAGDLAAGRTGASSFVLWRELYHDQLAWAQAEKLPPLLANFGVSFVERALIDATGRALGQTFAQMLQSNALSIELGAVHAGLGKTVPRDYLPSSPRSRIVARHTVGLSDPLTDESITTTDRLDDGLPQSLEAGIAAYGLRHFKLKINGDVERDVERLTQCAAIIRENAPADFAFTLDGNEQFKSLGQFQAFWETAMARPDLSRFFRHLLFVEQPLHRDIALQPEVGDAFRRWSNHPPIIIDESDATLTDLPTALELGYAGTSHKNCKGVFKGVAHRCWIERLRRAEPNRSLRMSGEDLCNIGPVALLQDLAVMAALGIESVERNGHHYHAGLSQFPPTIREAVLRAHGDLYQRSKGGWPTLRITDGQIDLGTVNRAPFGVGYDLDFSAIPETTV